MYYQLINFHLQIYALATKDYNSSFDFNETFTNIKSNVEEYNVKLKFAAARINISLFVQIEDLKRTIINELELTPQGMLC